MSLLTSEEIKSMALDLGADQCGIASIDRYDETPDGFHPHDI
jgi:epoxyqueuosine reductase QueG